MKLELKKRVRRESPDTEFLDMKAHDAEIIKNDVNMMIDYKIDIERKNNFDVNHKPVFQSIIYTIEQTIQEQNNKNYNANISKKM